ncbi:MAG: DUF1819 domain-containing protein [Bdellovibrionales bacterium CG10_big_fil_rev_8_21_14_0_10_45_34]|nr:MAG: DUF1819 domain-containing protein [Bdellovibrionales bacterium CG10_big_fil_rev_8_21_14_0_10_45_34]
MELIKEFDRRCIMADLKYNMSFTAGGLFLLESIPVAETYLQLQNWDKAKEILLSENTIQSKTNASLIRFNREVVSRLQLLTDDQIKLLVEGSVTERKLILWVAVCRKHKFINDFAIEVVREKFLQLNYKVTYKDFDIFFNQKAEWHDELDKLTDSTRSKVRQVLFRMMREADILLPNDEINRIHLTSKFIETMKRTNRTEFSIFPITELEISKALDV